MASHIDQHIEAVITFGPSANSIIIRTDAGVNYRITWPTESIPAMFSRIIAPFRSRMVYVRHDQLKWRGW